MSSLQNDDQRTNTLAIGYLYLMNEWIRDMCISSETRAAVQGLDDRKWLSDLYDLTISTETRLCNRLLLRFAKCFSIHSSDVLAKFCMLDSIVVTLSEEEFFQSLADQQEKNLSDSNLVKHQVEEIITRVKMLPEDQQEKQLDVLVGYLNKLDAMKSKCETILQSASTSKGELFHLKDELICKSVKENDRTMMMAAFSLVVMDNRVRAMLNAREILVRGGLVRNSFRADGDPVWGVISACRQRHLRTYGFDSFMDALSGLLRKEERKNAPA